MDMMGKAMFSHHVGKLKEDLGLKEDEEKTSTYDPQKEAEEEEQLAEQKQRRKEAQTKKQAERAANRNKIREKYGLKQNKHDQQLVTQHGKPSGDSETSRDDSSLTRRTSSQDKKDDKCAIM
ncbi:complexin-4-like isoform X2 [Lytechinus variegatus]|nr:complexin-4-like isoform X2 [Lytechinus variegatus]